MIARLAATAALTATMATGMALYGSESHAEAVNGSTWCQALQKQPKYAYSYQGARVEVPKGSILFRDEVKPLPKRERQSWCRALVMEYRHHVNQRY